MWSHGTGFTPNLLIRSGTDRVYPGAWREDQEPHHARTCSGTCGAAGSQADQGLVLTGDQPKDRSC